MPNTELKKTDRIVVTSDSVVLDTARQWTNLAAGIIAERLPQTCVINLGP